MGSLGCDERFPAHRLARCRPPNRRGTLHDGTQFCGRVILKPEHDAETIPQRTGQQPGTRGSAHQRESRKIQANRTRSGTLPHHDVEGEVLERRVQHLFDHAVQAMDLVDEQDIALLEVREDGRQIARALDGGAARRLDVRAQLVATTVASVVLPRPGGPENKI